ncbi:MAG: hypothetical protein ETSY2_21745 [Candidatus Entotheonella gemina]|uniref:Uncharacterized protein n=1 Tax=Candidatus Entotheonella gemina TaxID=1429439 RepID=W4M625_9BACT|nr:MAG: hypothetical protein ETSY2_21745 [Candidatus Entotheonella gemina]
MAERHLQQKLIELRNRTYGMHELISIERRYRQIFVAEQTLLFALDFDVVYDYLRLNPAINPLEDDKIERQRLVSALVEAEDIRFVLPSGSLNEFTYTLSRLLKGIWYRERSELREQLYNKSPHELIVQRRQVGIEWQAIKLAQKLLRSQNCLNLEDIGSIGNFRDMESSFFQNCYAYLNSRRPRTTVGNYNDSLNLVEVLHTVQNGIPLSLITGTRSVFEAFEAAWDSLCNDQSPPPVVLKANLGLFRLNLRRVTFGQLRELDEELYSIQGRLSDYIDTVANTTISQPAELPLQDISGIEERLLALSENLESLHTNLEQAWVPPIEEVPENLDLGRLAEAVITAREALLDEICTLLNNLQPLFGLAKRAMSQLSSESEAEHRLISLLEAAHSDTQSKLYIEKLVYVTQGGNMEDRSIRQNAGRDLTAVIDSFKGNTIKFSSAGHTELAEKLDTFLKTVEESSLPSDDKMVILSETSTVTQDVVQKGKLTARAKLLWGGIRNLVESVPEAVSAWEALTKMWS